MIEETIKELYLPDAKKAYAALKKLMAMSMESDAVYPYFDTFVDMIRNASNSYIRTRGLRLMAYNAKWDHEHKMQSYIHEYLAHIEDDKPITARQCIQDSVLIARYHPELVETILHALQSYHKIYEESMQSLIYKDRKKQSE